MHWEQCYLRLTTREYALSLLKRFEQRAGEEIVLELLDGRREEMYWECVPDKVRALAVQRSQAHQTRQGDGDNLRADNQDIKRDWRANAAETTARSDLLDSRFPESPTPHSVCRVVLYPKTHPRVSHDDADNMSTKNRENLSVSLEVLHLEGALQPVPDAPYLPDAFINPALETVQCLLRDPAPSTPIKPAHPIERQRTPT